MRKVCTKCHRNRDVKFFSKQSKVKSGLRSHCKDCVSEYSALHKASRMKYEVEMHRLSRVRSNSKLKSHVLALMGSKCCRCGFDNPLALQIDHINGCGRKNRECHDSIMRQIRDNPQLIGVKYQLLCANCNRIKMFTNDEHTGKANRQKHPTRLNNAYL